MTMTPSKPAEVKKCEETKETDLRAKFEQYCKENPDALECRIYEN